jgi:hypothetical protein
VYVCKRVDEHILARIRSDPGVGVVVCNFRFNTGQLTPAPDLTMFYRVPLLYSNNQHGENTPGRYTVILQPDHSLTGHSTAIGINILHYVQNHRQRTPKEYKYNCMDVDDELLGRIRRDRLKTHQLKQGRETPISPFQSLRFHP